jgi:hypothetical protein
VNTITPHQGSLMLLVMAHDGAGRVSGLRIEHLGETRDR